MRETWFSLFGCDLDLDDANGMRSALADADGCGDDKDNVAAACLLAEKVTGSELTNSLRRAEVLSKFQLLNAKISRIVSSSICPPPATHVPDRGSTIQRIT